MFGIGGTELIVIAVVLLIAVGPDRLPKLLKAAVKGYREFRKATRELRASTGIDEILQDEDLRDLRKPLYVPPAKKGAAGVKGATPAAKKNVLSYTERARENPPEGVDVAEVRDGLHRPSAEEAEKIRADKQAVVEAKIAAAREDGSLPDQEEHRRIVDAKLAAVSEAGEDAEDATDEEGSEQSSDERDRVIAEKLASVPAQPEHDPEERQRIIDAKLATQGAED